MHVDKNNILLAGNNALSMCAFNDLVIQPMGFKCIHCLTAAKNSLSF